MKQNTESIFGKRKGRAVRRKEQRKEKKERKGFYLHEFFASHKANA